MSTQSYRQCALSKAGFMDYITWIPSKFAKINKPLEILLDNEWSTGWIVKEIYSSIQDIDTQRDNHKRFQYVLGD